MIWRNFQELRFSKKSKEHIKYVTCVRKKEKSFDCVKHMNITQYSKIKIKLLRKRSKKNLSLKVERNKVN